MTLHYTIAIYMYFNFLLLTLLAQHLHIVINHIGHNGGDVATEE